MSEQIQDEVAEVGAEVVRARLVVPWLAGVPAIAFLLVSQWPGFHRSAARAFPTPHLKWRTDQFLQHVNNVLAAYTRAQALSALIVGVICGVGFALMALVVPSISVAQQRGQEGRLRATPFLDSAQH